MRVYYSYMEVILQHHISINMHLFENLIEYQNSEISNFNCCSRTITKLIILLNLDDAQNNFFLNEIISNTTYIFHISFHFVL